jgi:hypothetical protein
MKVFSRKELILMRISFEGKFKPNERAIREKARIAVQNKLMSTGKQVSLSEKERLVDQVYNDLINETKSFFSKKLKRLF